MGGMSNGPEILLVSISMVFFFSVYAVHLLSTVDRRHMSILAWIDIGCRVLPECSSLSLEQRNKGEGRDVKGKRKSKLRHVYSPL